MKTRKTYAKQKAMILGPFLDYLEGKSPDIDGFVAYLQHCRINLKAINADNRDGVMDAILEHYRTGPDSFDVERAVVDLRTEPRILARINQLRAAQSAGGA